MAELEDMNRFANEVAQWLIEKYGEYQDPMMMGGVLMRATMELYLSRLIYQNLIIQRVQNI